MLDISLHLYRYEATLEPLPAIPEMTFDKNVLRIQHEEGFGLEFNALDALKMVDAKTDLMKVAVAEAWKNSRSGVIIILMNRIYSPGQIF